MVQGYVEARLIFRIFLAFSKKRWKDSQRMVLQMQLGARPFQSEHWQSLLFLFEVQILDTVNSRDMSDSA